MQRKAQKKVKKSTIKKNTDTIAMKKKSQVRTPTTTRLYAAIFLKLKVWCLQKYNIYGTMNVT